MPIETMKEVIENKEFYCKHIFTLKSGKQITILTKVDYEDVVTEKFTYTKLLLIKGFDFNPLKVEKEIEIRMDEIASVERIMEFCILHQILDLEVHRDTTGGTKEKFVTDHKPGCASFNNPPAGFASSISDCDCGAVVLTKG